MKMKQYEKPSVEVVKLEQCEALLQASDSDEIFRPDYGDPIEQDWEDDDDLKSFF